MLSTISCDLRRVLTELTVPSGMPSDFNRLQSFAVEGAQFVLAAYIEPGVDDG